MRQKTGDQCLPGPDYYQLVNEKGLIPLPRFRTDASIVPFILT
jgi:hypothetical protein